MSNQEKLYISGFNSGYFLAKHIPTLLAKIIKNVSPAAPFIEGLFSGKEEYELEHSKIHINELSNLRNRSKDRDRDIER